MNLLAHAYLSNRQDGLIVGNFMGDFIKGDPTHPRHELTPVEIMGVRLHRAIDTFTDAHAEVAAARTLLYPRCHKYAGVAVDVFFDHFLAIRFGELTGDSLAGFTRFFYETLQRHTDRLPVPARRMLSAMVQYDWVTHYQTTDGIDRSLKGLSRRTTFASGLDSAIVDFERYYFQIGNHFDYFWPQLAAHARQTLVRLSTVG
ncbi:DUF479 domain-containing protein [Spirosoma taeanense]|uniref:DUF479 domain-containing protein n=1 Tax=Spirosoma taeanense TaxID=2735870 RepID=A0A6M5Y808_9BACT|nr:ACP phosphodiesterase [Spirosoma taeanense]QJW90029.1 DUF479 domain-containing protein [Spirosoma taeanense]